MFRRTCSKTGTTKCTVSVDFKLVVLLSDLAFVRSQLSRKSEITAMKYYKIVIEPTDASAQSRIILFGGYNTGDFYILELDETDMDTDQLETDLRRTAESVEIVEISKVKFESYSREKLGFFAPKPERHSFHKR
jgi:hypothetical protein